MSTPLKILITGRNGQVAQALLGSLQGSAEVVCLGRAELDLADSAAVRAQVRNLRPDLIINAAAYTAVDQAESEAE
ncbi:MAG: sugar nucleotide-binding protein, partial [Pseudomonas sp.]